ncbi:hypothetical protein GQ457_02G004190 [Hibiscus cannabinus]
MEWHSQQPGQILGFSLNLQSKTKSEQRQGNLRASSYLNRRTLSASSPSNMPPRRIDEVVSISKSATKNLKVRIEAKRVRTEMEKVREEQECLRDEQRKLITRLDEIERQCEMIEEQSAITRTKLVLEFRIFMLMKVEISFTPLISLDSFAASSSLQRLYYPMAPRKIDQVGSKSRTEKKLRVKAEMGKVREEQECLKDEQRKLITRFDEIAKQCDELKQETEMIEKQSAITRAKLVLMFGILKARESGDLVQAANLTALLREIVAMEKEDAIVDEAKDEEDP